MDDKMLTDGILQDMPVGYALHQFVLDQDEQPCDYRFIDINPEFERLTGLSATTVIGKRITEVLPEILMDEFDWIGTYAKTAFEDVRQKLEQYSLPLKKWFRVDAYSPLAGYFVTLIEDITEEKEKAQQFNEMQQILERQEIIISIYQLDHLDQQSFLQYILQSALKMLDSKHGYIFLYDESNKTFTINTWSDDVMPDCQIKDQENMYYLDQTGIWGEVVRQRKPIILNDFSAPNSYKKGYPTGHVPIRNFASVPVLLGGKIVAAVGVANKSSDYTAFDINQLTMLMQSAWLIMEAKQQIARVNMERHKYDQMLSRLPLMLCELDDSFRLTYINDAFCKFYELDRQQSIGKHYCEIVDQKNINLGIERFKKLSVNHPISHHMQQIERKKDRRWIEWRYFAAFNNQDKAVSYYSVGVDVTEKEEAMSEIKHLAYHDYLTGIYNRRFFDESFAAMNHEGNRPLAVIVGDINGLKLINDNFGHAAGDELIKAAVNNIRTVIQDQYILARTGGDEFAILLPQSSESAVNQLTNQLEEELELYTELPMPNKKEVYLSVTFGYGIQSEQVNSLDELVRQAENHIYRRKTYNDKSMRSHMIVAMMNTLFQKSEREERHSQRVSRYCELLAKALSWDVERVNRTRVAGSLHDIGKIGISENILNKPGRLNRIEWEIMKQHPIKSAKILEGTEEYSEIAEIIETHHERIDGTGYPNGLKGEAIPEEAMVIAVADAYDAMTQTRTYRETLTKEEAIAELYRCAGTQFHPKLVDIFVKDVLMNEGSD